MDSHAKNKIVNDPVYGFINIPHGIVYDLIEHRYFQRLRYIRQLGLTGLVYPGAVHTRFQHALGAMHLMGLAIDVLRHKGHSISDAEAEAALVAILLHDIGHGPFSHALEFSIVPGVSHEKLSVMMMEQMNRDFDGKLELAIRLFSQQYPKKYLHQLVSSQLDMDRLDYLNRDSFFTGVSEGVVSYDRIIKMLEIVNGELVVEAKGIYSIEKFLIARRLMYWQVYLHKTVLAAELMLVQAMKRVRHLISETNTISVPENLRYFLQRDGFDNENELIESFALIDDSDILVALKQWSGSKDFVLHYLSSGLVHRRLFKVITDNKPFVPAEVERIRSITSRELGISTAEAEYLVFTDIVSNNAYSFADDQINILMQGRIVDITRASDMFNHSVLSKTVTKYVLCYPKDIITAL
ncbi:MAG TPA: HD domain-containing protein [Bacteroidales bacterium]|nr:HD domain-containing protein [Bacteroidales bacterium]